MAQLVNRGRIKHRLLIVGDPKDDRPRLTPHGHDFALTCNHDEAMAVFASETGGLDLNHPCHFASPGIEIPERDFGAGMPPVVSWQQSTVSDIHQDRFLLHLIPELPCFDGHFPGQPILAGIIQLHWAVRLAQTIHNLAQPPREILRLKFHNIVVPPRFVELRLESSDHSRIQFRVLSKDCVHAQGMLLFGDCD